MSYVGRPDAIEIRCCLCGEVNEYTEDRIHELSLWSCRGGAIGWVTCKSCGRAVKFKSEDCVSMIDFKGGRVSVVGKVCFKCEHLLTDEEIDKITGWADSVNSDFGIAVDDKINYPDEDAVTCLKCHNKAVRQVKREILRESKRVAQYVIWGGWYGGPDYEVVCYDGEKLTVMLYGGPGYRLKDCRRWLNRKYPKERYDVKFSYKGGEWQVDVFKK